MERVGAFIAGVVIAVWGVRCFRRRSFPWRGSPRDEATEPQEPAIFWFSVLVWIVLLGGAFGMALGLVPVSKR